MDSFLQKFSLQNLLRQFFCGVVFFVPLWLFNHERGCKCCSCSIVDITTWETGTFLIFASLASVIGTIIYHVEKNLHSYPLQLAYEYYYQRKRSWWVCLLLLLLILVPMICLVLVSCAVLPEWILLVAIGVYAVLAFFLLRTGHHRIITPTTDAWNLERMAQSPHRVEVEPTQKQEEKFRSLSAVSHLSTWSDFIHCVQSCCFAWVLGCCIVQFRFGYAHVPSPGDEGLCPLLPMSVIGAALLLVLEMLIDMHRYRFVKTLTSKSGSDDSSPAVSKRVDSSNTIIENVHVLHFSDESSLAASSHSSNTNDKIQVSKETFYEKTKLFIIVVNLILKIVKMIKRK